MSQTPVPTRLQLALYRIVALCCFNRITVHGRPTIPAGAVLYLGLHRNGALDGLPYAKATPGAAFIVSAQLHRSALGRFAFPGIPVSRNKDRQRGIATNNCASIDHCIDHLAAGGELFIMPEGTSSLGPHHLPFQPGAARIARAVLERGVALTVVPMAVHYECAWEWQSRVEVAFGEPHRLRPEEAPSVEALHDLFSTALVDIGVNLESEERMELVEMLAYGATLGTGHSYTSCLKNFERSIPGDVLADAASLEAAAGQGLVLRHQGVPLVPIRHFLLYWLAWAALVPPMVAFVVANLPILLAGYWGSRALPDDRNVIAFWRMAVAMPIAAIWCPLMLFGLAYLWGAAASLLYGVVSLTALRMVYRFRKLTIAVFNSIFARRLRSPLLALHTKLSQCIL